MRAARESGGALWVALAALALVVLVLVLALSRGQPAEPGAAARPSRAAPGAATSEAGGGAAPRVEAPAASAELPPVVAAEEAKLGAPAASVGTLRIEVLDVNGAPLAEFPLFVERGATQRREQLTDASGLARFDALELGAWRVLLGDHERPLLPATPVELREGEAPLVRLALSAPLTEVEVEVLDEAGRPAPNVALRTRCARGGVSRGVTDHAGRAVLRHVSLGPVRVFATDERLGRGNRAVEIAAGERPKVQVALANRP